MQCLLRIVLALLVCALLARCTAERLPILLAAAQAGTVKHTPTAWEILVRKAPEDVSPPECRAKYYGEHASLLVMLDVQAEQPCLACRARVDPALARRAHRSVCFCGFHLSLQVLYQVSQRWHESCSLSRTVCCAWQVLLEQGHTLQGVPLLGEESRGQSERHPCLVCTQAVPTRREQP